MQAFLGFRASARSDVEAFLCEHASLRELLEPMLRPEPEPDPIPVREFGDYLLGRELGRGGMGVVYEAVQRSLGRRVALKLLPLGASAAPLATVRLQREARLVARLSHPGIVQVFEAGVHQGTAFYAMELVDGRTLTEGLQSWREQGLPHRSGAAHRALFGASADGADDARDALAVALDVALQAADALAYAHERGIVHRDVKPGNLLLSAAGRVYLTDFGIARSNEPGFTLTAEAAGTPWYMAPEQALGATGDHRVDVFALGTVLFELVTGARAFPGATAVEVVERMRRAAPPDPRGTNARVSADLAAVVMKSMAVRPADRYATMAEFARDLRALQYGSDVAARPPTRFVRLRRWARREPWRAVAAVLGLAALLGGAVGAMWFTRALVEESERTAVALAEVNRLSLGVRLDVAERTARGFVGRGPAALAAMRAWLRDEGEPLAAELPSLRRQLELLRARAVAYATDDAEQDRSTHPSADELDRLEREIALKESAARLLDEQIRASDLGSLRARRDDLRERVAQRRTWVFVEPANQFLHDEMTRLVDRLAAFAEGASGGLAEVRGELTTADRCAAVQRELGAPAWASAAAAVAADPRYRGLALVADDELLPLGADPASGLHEFLHVRSHATAPVAARVDGRVPGGEGAGIVFVLVPPGDAVVGGFGAEQENGQRVRFDAFLLAKHELTQAQWLRLAGDNPSRMHPRALPDGRITLLHPVESVVPARAVAMLARQGLQLPTEAQWEYACRAGTTAAWSFGEREQAPAFANFADAAAGRLGVQFRCEGELDDGHVWHAPVGSFRANAWGLFDMHGNVAELCPGPSMVSGVARDGDGRCAGLWSNRALFVLRGGSCQSLLRDCQAWTCGYSRADAAAPLGGLRPVRALRR
ncbi:MAG: protein kinase [Planctomycetes bacterium]|nr:protein kinase [Planctomycetota bacterium]